MDISIHPTPLKQIRPVGALVQLCPRIFRVRAAVDGDDFDAHLA